MVLNITNFDKQSQQPSGIMTPKRGWTLSMINSFTKEETGFCIDDLYTYEVYNQQCNSKLLLINKTDVDSIDLDEYMWSEFVEYLEKCRLFVFEVCMEEGVNECESYFLSLKFVRSTLKKFRGKFYRELDNREDYDSTPLKVSINFLIYRTTLMMAADSYKFSAKAADGKLGSFRTNCAWETARHLAEETGIIFHAKVTL